MSTLVEVGTVDVMSDDGEPRWLDDDEFQAWIVVVAMMTRLPAALDRQLRRDAGMSHYEYQVLAVLSLTEGHTLRMSSLAAMTEGSLPRLSQVVSRLEASGDVMRRSDPDDGRFTLATLTDAGQARLAAAAPGHVEEVRRLVFDAISPELLEPLRIACRQVLGAIDPDRPDLMP